MPALGKNEKVGVPKSLAVSPLLDCAAIDNAPVNRPSALPKFTRAATLAAVGALLGKIPTTEEYMAAVGSLSGKTAEVYRYMNFDQIPEFVEVAEKVAV